MSQSKRGRPGRRPGPSTTREAIVEAARGQFAALGYDGATMRGIAAQAGVDPALVVHFFQSKRNLFVSVMAPPFEPEEVMPRILAGRRSDMGRRLAEFAVGVLEDPQAREVITGVLRAAASQPETAELVRDVVAERILGAVAGHIDAQDARLRASLVASQVIGLVMARYIVRAEPLASLAPEALVDAIAPTLQRYLTGRLPATGPAGAKR